jgi:hypothetical protein
MADKKTYRERTIDVVGADDSSVDRQRLKKTRPGFFKDEPHTQESMMRGLEEAEVAEKGMLGRAANKLKTNILGSAVDNELAGEREAEQAAKNPEGNQAKFRKMMGKNKGGTVVYKKGGKVRGCGCAQKGLTKGRMV